jgi:hypothetical protein
VRQFPVECHPNDRRGTEAPVRPQEAALHFLKISTTQVINLDTISHIEIYETGEACYATLHFTSGQSYRCTEDETEVLVPYIEGLKKQ